MGASRTTAKARRRKRAKAKPAAKRARKPVAPAEISWDAVAVAAGIDLRRLHRLRLSPGAPTTKDVDAWRAFAAARAAAAAAAASPERVKSASEIGREQADLRHAQARAEREERANALEAGSLLTKEQAQAAADLVRDAFIVAGELLPAAVLALVPKLGKTDRQAVEEAVRAAWTAARERITQGAARD